MGSHALVGVCHLVVQNHGPDISQDQGGGQSLFPQKLSHFLAVITKSTKYGLITVQNNNSVERINL